MRATVVVSLTVAMVLGGCTSHGAMHSRPSLTATPTLASAAVVHLRALLQSTHPNSHGRVHTFHAPLSGQLVRATSVMGERTTALVDARGLATMTLAPGRYVLTLLRLDTCYPLTVTIRARTEPTIALPCAAP